VAATPPVLRESRCKALRGPVAPTAIATRQFGPRSVSLSFSAHARLADRLFWCESCAHNMRPAASRGEGGCAPRRALAVGTLPRPLRGLPGPRHSCQHLLSCLDVRCGTVEPPQPQARRRAQRPLSRPARPGATALLYGLAGRRSRPSIGRCIMLAHFVSDAANFFWVEIIRTLTPPQWPNVRWAIGWRYRILQDRRKHARSCFLFQ